MELIDAPKDIDYDHVMIKAYSGLFDRWGLRIRSPRRILCHRGQHQERLSKSDADRLRRRLSSGRTLHHRRRVPHVDRGSGIKDRGEQRDRPPPGQRVQGIPFTGVQRRLYRKTDVGLLPQGSWAAMCALTGWEDCSSIGTRSLQWKWS